MHLRKTLSFLLLAPTLLCAQAGPGWLKIASDENMSAAQAIFNQAQTAPPPLLAHSSAQQSSSSGPQALMSSTASNDADIISPEIQELARGLQNDPVQIFEYCYNYIDYEHYWGSKKGATLTLLEGSGNSFDTAALMVSLLRAAGYSAQYRYGSIELTDAQLAGWLGTWFFGDGGVPFPHWTDTEFRTNTGTGGASQDTLTLRYLFNNILYHLDRGYPAINPADAFGFDWYVPHVWVEFEVSGTSYEADPSLKFLSLPSTPTDIEGAMNYNRSTLLNEIKQGATVATHYVQNLNESNLATRLTAYTTTLTQWLKANKPNSTVDNLLGLENYSRGSFDTLADIPVVNYTTAISYLQPTDWTVIPESWMTKLIVTAGEYNYSTEQFGTTRYTETINMPALAGRKFSLTFNGNTGTLSLDEALFGTGSSFSVPNADIDVRLSIDHAHGTYNQSTGVWSDDGKHDQEEVKAYVKDDTYAYAFLYGFKPSGRLLRKRQEVLDGYLRDPAIADNSTEVITELLNIMGLNWLLQTEYSETLVASQFNISNMSHHRLGRMGQEEGYYVDVGLIFSGVLSLDSNTPDEQTCFQIQTLFDSALEHSLIQQMQGEDKQAASTIRMLQLANEQGESVYRATPSNWSSVVRPRLNSQGYNSSVLNSIEDFVVNEAANVLIPDDPTIALDQWDGTGYAIISGTTAGMIISGDYFGGFLSIPDTLTPEPITDFGYSDSTYFDTGSSGLIFGFDPITTPSYYGADPVDMASGSFVYDKTDLQLGQAMPRGLVFARHYDSNRRYDDSKGLGFGWTHNLDIFLTERSSIKAGLGQTTNFQMAPYLVGIAAARDLFENGADAAEWQSACLAIKWATDQLLYKTVAITMGKRTLELVEMPDGTYAPPAGITMTLSKNGQDNYVLSERHGNTYTFNADNRIETITDLYNQSQSFTYTNDQLTQVQDSYSRALTLTWTNGKITSVADGTGRNTGFSYTGDDLTTVTDADGHDWTFAYDAEHRMTILTDPKSQVIVSNTFDSKSRVQSQQSEGDPSKTWNLYWTGYRNIEENPQGGQTVYFYDERGRSIGIENALGEGDGRGYDGQDHMTVYTSPEFEFTIRRFDSENNLIEISNPLFDEAFNVYDAQNRRITETDFRGNDMTYTYNAQHQILTVTDRENILIQTNTYDSLGRLKTVTDADSHITTYSYDSNGYRNRIDYPDTTFETLTFNARGDLLSRTDRRGNTTSFTYNGRRQLLVTTFPDTSTRANVYDSCGNLISETDNEGNTVSFTYSPTKKQLVTTLPTSAAGTATITNLYDTRDWMESTTDPLTHQTSFTYDAAGRTVTATDPLSRDFSQTFDANGRVLTASNAENETTGFSYDPRGLQDTQTDALNRDITYSFDENGNPTGIVNRRSQSFTYTHDANNRQLTLQTPLGHTTTHTWDDRGLLETIVEPSTQTATFTYDSMARVQNMSDNVGTITYGYDNNGNPITVTEGSVTLTRVFDNRNRVTSYTDAHGNTIGYQYDSNSNLTQLTYPDNKTVTYAYDDRNQLTSITDWNSRVTNYTYDLNGRLIGISRHNGTTRTIVYDAAGQITRLEERKADGRLLNLQDFGFDDAGRITREFIAPIPQSFDLPTNTVTYDNNNRIATFNGLNVTHDVDGNMTSGPLTGNTLETHVYDARNRLASVGGISYQYDAENNRIGQADTSGTTNYAIDPNTGLSKILIRTKPDGSKTFYVYGMGLQYEVDESEDTLTYHYDYRGSTRMLTADDGQTVTDQIEYTPYGVITYRTGNTDTPFLYNGMFGVMADANGLLQMRARYFNPFLKRFINQDPIGFTGGMNWFAFASGSPIGFIDPNGFKDFGLTNTDPNFVRGGFKHPAHKKQCRDVRKRERFF